MKKDIHPESYRLCVFKDMSNDFTFLTRSCTDTKDTIKWEDGNEYPLVKLEISNMSHPDNYTALQNLGTLYKLTDRMDLAAEQWKKVLKIKKDFVYAYQELSKYYLSKNDTINYVSCQRAISQIK